MSAGSTRVVNVVAAENEYGDIAAQLGGVHAQVTSLMKSPNTDPHEFEASPSTARDIATADVVVENGLGYDAWVDSILGATPRSGRAVVTVGALLQRHTGDNPHVWYDPAGWPVLARVIARRLSAADPRDASYFARRKKRFLASLRPIEREVVAVRRRADGRDALATEPVYGYMTSALGFTMLGAGFQKAIMDGNDPPPADIISFQRGLTRRSVRLLLYNRQASEAITEQMQSLATTHHIPVVGVTESEPGNTTFQRWQMSELQAVARALS
jgi:zinc/manganese transport system substrate-binding protein